MFTSVHIKNFRAIKDLEIGHLGRVNLFVGHNACGKTTLLESIFFLIGATNPKLPLSVNTFRGMPWVGKALWRTYFHNMNTDVPIEILADESEDGGRQRLLIRPREERFAALNGDASSMLSPDWSEGGPLLNGLRLEYSGAPDPASPQVSHVYMKAEEIVVEGMKERSIRGTFVIPLPLDLSNRFSEVQRRKQTREVAGLLKHIEPAIEDLRLGGGPGGLIYADIGAPELIPVNLMGGGTTRLLSVALAMLNFQNGYVLIDEVENGLHHSAQTILWDAIFTWAQKLNIQVFASTHSMECVRAFTGCAKSALFGVDAMLFRIEREGDKSRAVEYTRESLAESLESGWEVR